MESQLKIADIIIRKDSLSLDIQHLSTRLPDSPVLSFSALAHANLNGFTISNTQLSLGDSKLNMELVASYNHWADLLYELDKANLEIAAFSSMNAEDLRFFLADSITYRFESWPNTELGIEGSYNRGLANIDTLSIQIGNSDLLASARIDNLLNPDSIFWQDLSLTSTIESGLKSLLLPDLGNFSLPEKLLWQLTSSGNLKRFELTSKVHSEWGTINLAGNAGLVQNSVVVDLTANGEGVAGGKFMELDWLGPTDLSVHAAGNLRNGVDMELKGHIDKTTLFDNEIHNIEVSGNYNQKGVIASIAVNDSTFNSGIQTEILFNNPFSISANLQLNEFGLGKLLNRDSTLSITGLVHSEFNRDQNAIEGSIETENLTFESSSGNYSLDSLAMVLISSTEASSINIYSDDLLGMAKANFDFRESPEIITRFTSMIKGLSDSLEIPQGERKLSFDFGIENIAPLKLFNDKFEDFAGVHISGKFDEATQSIEIEAETSNFSGFGISLDSLHANFSLLPDQINTNLDVNNILYDNTKIGNLDFQIQTAGDSIHSNFDLYGDSVSILGIASHIQKEKDGYNIYLNSLYALNQQYVVDRSNPIFIGPGNLLFDHFVLTKEDLEISANGDLDNFQIDINNADLTNLNLLMPTDSTVIYSGFLNGALSYSKSKKHIDLKARIDSLTLENTPVITIDIQATTEGNKVPVEFILSSSSNNITFAGDYFINNSQIEALLDLDINNLEMFQFLFSEQIEEMYGQVKGETKITGTLQEPKYQGSLRFIDTYLTTIKPRSKFQLINEVITLDNSGIILEDFTIIDQLQNPLSLNGALKTKDFQTFEYDFTLDTDNYLFLDNPKSEEYPLQGILVLGTNLKFSGTEKDTQVEANIIIRDTTDLTYVMPRDDLELLTNEGIVEFVDPSKVSDSIVAIPSQSFYDSLMSTLPKFNLNSQITLEDEAVLKVIVDARSGDFIEASGAANLSFNINRTGNTLLEGKYSIDRGFYQLSFYDMVKKKFDIAPGSFVTWTGNPNDGALDFKAIHRINTSSIGLIGHEIGENEQDLYKKSLPYEVGIIIKGTITNPIISFDLDLPQDDKTSYPALANKLDQFKQPEYESELNKQVFGLLVLGGFIPEASGTEFDQSLIATTALTNSVNNILASQLNRFAGQLIKGVDINVGLQSYSDYTSSSGGQTRTAMDVRVSKHMMDDRLSIEVGGGMDLNPDQTGTNYGDNFRGDITVIYDLTESGTKQLKIFNNETYDIIYHEVRNTGISLIFIKDFDKGENRQNDED